MAATMTVTLAFGVAPPAAPDNNNTKKLLDAVTVAGVMSHQQALQGIATANGGTRASGTPGYDASVAYVVDKLTAAGYTPSVQAFQFPFPIPSVLERVAPGFASYPNSTFTFSGTGNFTANAQFVDVQVPHGPVDNSSTSACESGDFAGFIPGNIAVVQRGSCNFSVKAANAQAAGAVAMVVFNEGQPFRTDVTQGTLGSQFTIPVVGASYATGVELYELRNSGLQLHVAVSPPDIRTTYNVIAETATGRDDNVVVVGAHLDSVPAGPGINDNGTGSSTILEVAVKMAKVTVRNTVRFMWFGAEERGLLGSNHYVSQLSAAERDDIALMLNFDMVGSPNFVRFVYDGDNSAFPVGPNAAAGPPGSGPIEALFASFFASRGLASEPTAFSGRSDYGPFIAVGIPAGGLFTGAEGLKTAPQAAIYGGTAGQPYDPCYHQECDTIANVNTTVLDQMADAVAFATLTYAQSTESVNGEKGKGNFKGSKPVPEPTPVA